MLDKAAINFKVSISFYQKLCPLTSGGIV